MPTISATPYPDEDYVLVRTDWSDSSSQVTHVQVTRTNEATGEQVLLRPHTAYSGSGCQMLDCGQALFWDTEPPLGVPLTYCATPCLLPTRNGRRNFIYDTFTRINAASWLNADSGQTYSYLGTGSQSVNGTEGVLTVTAANASRTAVLNVGTPPVPGNGTMYMRTRVPFVPTGASVRSGMLGRYVDGSNHYVFEMEINPTGTIDARILLISGGVPTVLADVLTPYTHATGTVYNMRVLLSTTAMAMRVWPITQPEPFSFQAFTSDATISSAVPINPGIRDTVTVGNTNVLPLSFFHEQFTVDWAPVALDLTVGPCTTVTLESEKLWLKNPLYPCLDLELITCGGADVFGCEDGTRQIVFLSMDEEVFEPNTALLAPVNRRRVIPVNRVRRDITSTLILVSRTFADRDALRASNAPGTPLLFQVPPQYGIADRYMSIGTVTEARGLPDHRFQPRVVSLPHAVVDRPEGPADGPCGTRYADLCDTYDSWAAITAVGLTWDNLMTGAASPSGPGQPPVSSLRTWQDVLDEFGTWGAVNTGGRTWQDTLDGS